MDKTTVIEIICREIVKAGNQTAFGAMFGYDQSYVSCIISGKREIPQAILDYIGVERVEEVTYRRKK